VIVSLATFAILGTKEALATRAQWDTSFQSLLLFSVLHASASQISVSNAQIRLLAPSAQSDLLESNAILAPSDTQEPTVQSAT
jgi:hypothetical protein